MESDELLEKNIINDIMNIINMVKKSHSKSAYNVLVSDLIKLYSLSQKLDLNNIPDIDKYSYKSYTLNENKILKEQKNYYLNNYEFNCELMDNYSYLFNKYKINDNYNLSKISLKENLEITKKFLTSFNIDILNEFNKLILNKRLIYVEGTKYKRALENEGETTYGDNFKPYVLVENYNTIFTSLTTVHEVGHVYDFKKNNKNINNYTREIYSHFLELVYYDYLKENKLDSNVVLEDYFDSYQENILDLKNLLNMNLKTNLDFKLNYPLIFSTIEYTYGMIFGLIFYDFYKKDKERGIYNIEQFLSDKDKYNEPIDIINSFNINKDEFIEGKILKKYLRREI